MIAADILAHVPVREAGFFDPLYLDFLDGHGFLRERLASAHLRPESWAARAARRAGVRAPEAVWRAMAAQHERWGAPEASRRALAELAEGRAVAVVAGQQPDALGGPLFTLHKALTAVALAREIEERGGPRAVPVFWSANEDSDFEEVRTVRFLAADLEAREVALPSAARVPGGMVGAIGREALLESWERAAEAWRGLRGALTAAAWLERARAAAGDLGDTQAILLLAALGDLGLVVLDPRLGAFREAARPLYARYLERHARVRAAVDAAGQALEEHGYARAILPAQSEFSLFAVDGAVRTKPVPAEAPALLARGTSFSPNVVLRPLVQDALLPAVFLVAGPGEIAYLSQLKEAYAELGVEASDAYPRLTATWLPAAACELARAGGPEPWELVRDADRALREMAERSLPAATREGLERLREEANRGLRSFAELARAVDASLPQLVESARGKVDFQYGRVHEALVAKARARLERAHPQAARLRHALAPGGRPQERRLAWLDLVARGGPEVVGRGLELAREHLRRAAAAGVAHALVALPGADTP